jgi:hypothetical protein
MSEEILRTMSKQQLIEFI